MKPSREIFYERTDHTTGTCVPCGSRKMVKGSSQGLLSSVVSQGIKKIKDKWHDFYKQKLLKKEKSLFIAPSGGFLAIAAMDCLIILQKDDKYSEPCGSFSGSNELTFRHGSWAERASILAIVDDMDTIYFVKFSGEEIRRITRSQLNLSASVIGLFLLQHDSVDSSCVCTFNMVTSNGLLYQFGVGKEASEIITSRPLQNHLILKRDQKEVILCLDFHQELAILVTVSSIGTYEDKFEGCSVSLWHVSRNSEIKFLSSTQYRGFLSATKSHSGPLIVPKVLISPDGKNIVVVDTMGHLNIFQLGAQGQSVSLTSFNEVCYQEMRCYTLPDGRKCISEVADFTWWAVNILVIATTNGSITVIDITGENHVKINSQFHLPVLGSAVNSQRLFFVLETIIGENGPGEMIYDGGSVVEASKLSWKLTSFSERSALEMFQVLLGSQQYQAALDLADHHGMDKDEIYKSQWLSSSHGAGDINSFLKLIKDQKFVISECVNVVGPTEESTNALLSHGLDITNNYRYTETGRVEKNEAWDFRVARLQLLQHKDKLESFMGINMGRFAMEEYRKIRALPLKMSAVKLAENGKIGALNLLFKRHPYSVCPYILDILSAIPETIPVSNYRQLLPGKSPPSSFTIREKDWVEGDEMVSYIQHSSQVETGEVSMLVKTEYFLKQSTGISWPSSSEITKWYKERALAIDNLSGQLENCLCLLEVGCNEGLQELQQSYNSVSLLCKFLFSEENAAEGSIRMNLADWEQLSEYGKFKLMMEGVTEENVVEKLHSKKLLFMQHKLSLTASEGNHSMEEISASDHKQADSLLIRWLKETAAENKLELCLRVLEEGCRDIESSSLFRDEKTAAEAGLDCLYLCTLLDQWATMATILSVLPLVRGKPSPAPRSPNPRYGTRGFTSSSIDNRPLTMLSIGTSESLNEIEKRVKVTEGHVEVGRLLAYYQVPKPLNFFLTAHTDEKGVKQLLRLMLSKFGRRQPVRSDGDWSNVWRDMLSFHEKAFPFLDKEYLLLEYCRGLLKAGKFSLARSYLKGIGNIPLPSDKAENLVIQAAREYLFSASSLDCTEIWKARECFNLFPNSKNVRVEIDIVDALTVKLPNLGVTILPLQYRQIRSPMEIINMAIRSQGAAYLNVEEILEVAKLLGLKSSDDIAAIREAVAREAALIGDLHQAFDLCLVLAREGYGPIWDLCAAIGRGPALEDVDISSRKQLLGFALSHCDEESVHDLLQAWKSLELQHQYEELELLSGSKSCHVPVRNSFVTESSLHNMQGTSGLGDHSTEEVEDCSLTKSVPKKELFGKVDKVLLAVAKGFSCEQRFGLNGTQTENEKFLSFVFSKLPWLLEIVNCNGLMLRGSTVPGNSRIESRLLASKLIIHWLANNNIAPCDDIIVSLAKSMLQAPLNEEEDAVLCSYLLNLSDAFKGVEVIEDEMHSRKRYQDISNIMNTGMSFSMLHNAGSECVSPSERRNLLLKHYHEKNLSLSSGIEDKSDGVQSTFWKEWKSKLEEKRQLADQTRVIEEMLPKVDSSRFLSGDKNYIRDCVFSFVDSVKCEKKHVLQNALKLADDYGIFRIEVLLRYLTCALLSDIWTVSDIENEISDHRHELYMHSVNCINVISSTVYPLIDGCDKKCLAYLYSILSEFYCHLSKNADPTSNQSIDDVELSKTYTVLEQECIKVSSINELNFKNIVGLFDLNYEHFNDEILHHVNEATVTDLAQMAETLVNCFSASEGNDLLTLQEIYKHHVVSCLKELENDKKSCNWNESLEESKSFVLKLMKNYENCRSYIRDMSATDILDIYVRYYTLSVPEPYLLNPSRDDSMKLEYLILLLNLWSTMAYDIRELESTGKLANITISSNVENLARCLTVFRNLVIDEKVSVVQGWTTVFCFFKDAILGGFRADDLEFCKSMIFAGCTYRAIADVYAELTKHVSTISEPESTVEDVDITMLCHLYVDLVQLIFVELESGDYRRENLHSLLLSLSEEDTSDDLHKVRISVWGRLCSLSEDTKVPQTNRRYALELLHSIAGSNHSGRVQIASDVQPWKAWPESLSIAVTEPSDSNGGNPVSSKFTSTLVALRSNEMISSAWPDLEITVNDLLSVQSAVSCFSYLATTAVSDSHFHVLQRLIEEWEVLFMPTETITCVAADENCDGSPSGTNWTDDEWADGWETDVVKNEDKDEHNLVIHPLHACWRILLMKLVGVSKIMDVVKFIDRSLASSKGVPLNEEEARSLNLLLINADCFVALKANLLLPYKEVWFDCFNAVNAKLKDGSTSLKPSGDHELVALIISSGALSSISTDSRYASLFSFLCNSAGYLSHLHQEELLCILKSNRSIQEMRVESRSQLFGRIIFPFFISELVIARNFILASAIVAKFMHISSSFSLINIAEAVLRKFLNQCLESENTDDLGFEMENLKTSIPNATAALKKKLLISLRSAISAIN